MFEWHFVVLARRDIQNVPIRAVYVDVPKDLCFHMNAFRSSNPNSDDPRSVPSMIIHGFYKNVEKPTVRDVRRLTVTRGCDCDCNCNCDCDCVF